MGSFSDYVEEAILNELFRGVEFTAPTTIYMGLATAPVTDTSTLATVAEEDDVDYVRKEAVFDAPVEGDSGSEIKNQRVLFEPYAANADLPVAYGFVTDTTSGTTGEILAHFALVESVQPTVGEVVDIKAGTLAISLD